MKKRDELLWGLAERLPWLTRPWLDVGAGDGSAGLELYRHILEHNDGAAQPVQIDVSPGGAAVRPFDGRRLPFGNGEFEWCLFNFVLHHAGASDGPELIREARRVCRRGIVVQEDLDDGKPRTWRSLQRHHCGGWFLSASSWIFELRLHFSHVEATFHPSDAEDVPHYNVPRALFVATTRV